MTREMSKAQFLAALKRNDFGSPILGMWVEDKKFPGTSRGLVYRQKPFKLMRRASIVHLLACRARDLKSEKASP